MAKCSSVCIRPYIITTAKYQRSFRSTFSFNPKQSTTFTDPAIHRRIQQGFYAVQNERSTPVNFSLYCDVCIIICSRLKSDSFRELQKESRIVNNTSARNYNIAYSHRSKQRSKYLFCLFLPYLAQQAQQGGL
jgi:hypothetical protein